MTNWAKSYTYVSEWNVALYASIDLNVTWQIAKIVYVMKWKTSNIIFVYAIVNIVSGTEYKINIKCLAVSD